MTLIKYEARSRKGVRNLEFYRLLNLVDDPQIKKLYISSNGIDCNIFGVKAYVRSKGTFLKGRDEAHINRARSKLERETGFALIHLSRVPN